MTSKTAVILFNLGGPDKAESIRPFLINFFMDKNIIRAPLPVRFLVSRLIAYRRSKKEAGTSYGMLGGKSPLLENTQAQADALQAKLGDQFKVFVVMRYWHPMAAEVAAQVQAYNPDEIILLPLYPQYSTTTTRSSFEDWFKAAQKINLEIPTEMICCYRLIKGLSARLLPISKPPMMPLLQNTALPRVCCFLPTAFLKKSSRKAIPTNGHVKRVLQKLLRLVILKIWIGAFVIKAV